MSKCTSNLDVSQYYSWKSVSFTDSGKVRSVNEDSYMSDLEAAHWVVADGMGGHSAGDVASQMIVDSLSTIGASKSLYDFVLETEKSLKETNSKLLEQAIENGTVIGSTVVGLKIHSASALWYWIGDSRAYLFRQGRLLQLSVDHTVPQELLLEGKITLAEVENHPEKNVITRAVGSEKTLFLDLEMMPLHAEDLYIICSDGVEKEINDAELEQILKKNSKDIDAAGGIILNTVMERGARDNVTFTLIEISRM